MRALAILVVAACSSAPASSTSNPSTPHQAQNPSTQTPAACGAAPCNAAEICVPGGEARNGIGETVQLAPVHCAPLPASCAGVATCACVGDLCPLGSCVSTDNRRLLCVSG